MSAVKRIMEAKKKPNSKRAYIPQTWSGGNVLWGDLNAATLMELIENVSSCGGALRFGRSRDGGALALGVYGDGDTPYTVYAGNVDEMEDHINALHAVFEVMEEMAK